MATPTATSAPRITCINILPLPGSIYPNASWIENPPKNIPAKIVKICSNFGNMLFNICKN